MDQRTLNGFTERSTKPLTLLKGQRKLTPGGSVLDYLSIIISLTKDGDICLDNHIRINDTLQKMGLTQCNPTKKPINRALIKALAETEKESQHCSAEEHSLAWTALGEAHWFNMSDYSPCPRHCCINVQLIPVAERV